MGGKSNPVFLIFKRAISKILIKWYNLPTRKIAVYNGVAIRNSPLLNKIDVNPDHEAQLIAAIRRYVENGETAVIVGGGTGPSTVVTAHQVGQKGSVTTFEAVEKLIKIIRETVDLNKVDDRVTIHHAIVEKPIYLPGEQGRTPLLPASKLPQCNALIMDCEGAELPILQNIKIRPRIIIVETHKHFGASEEKVGKVLTDLNYQIVSKDLRSDDIFVLTALQKK